MDTQSLYKYYGGKANLAQRIVRMIPRHRVYCEPFFGSGAVFFAKADSEVSLINDRLGIVVNFWRVVKDHFEELKEQVNGSLHSRDIHKEAKCLLNLEPGLDDVRRAWAFWYSANFSFAGVLGGGWGYSKSGVSPLVRKLDIFNSFAYKRLQNTYIENKDALDLFEFWDGYDTFWYCDPPYINTEQGHYKGYSEADYEGLLEKLSGIQGKFILSSYPNTILEAAVRKHGWESTQIGVKCNAKRCNTREDRVEVLAWNFETEQERGFFDENGIG